MTNTDEALHLYHRRQVRAEHPDGEFDKARRWYPSADECRDCCRSIRYPSRAWPYSLMVHCRSLRHVALLLDVDPSAARSALAKMIAAQRPARTAPSGLCVECGASWACQHQTPTVEAQLRANLHAVPDDRADFSRHLGQ